MGLNQEKTKVLTPQTLAGASAVLTTAAIPCRGAIEVLWYTKATNAITPSAVVYEYSADEAVNWLPADASFFDALQSNIVATDNSKGRVAVLKSRSAAASPILRIIATHVRLRITGNVGASPANDITGFEVDAVGILAS